MSFPDLSSELNQLIQRAWQTRTKHFAPTLIAYHPGLFRIDGKFGSYKAISMTGRKCELNCLHCQGKLLRGMVDGSDASGFLEKCQQWAHEGIPGILISGGADSNGELPWSNYIPAIRHLKSTTNLHISIHLGLAEPETVRALNSAGINLMMFDLVSSPEIFRTVFHQSDGYKRMMLMIQELIKQDIPVAPHIILGLNDDCIDDSLHSLNLIKDMDIESLVVIQFMPLSGTPFSGKGYISMEKTVEFLARARVEFPTTPISLGCARNRPNTLLEQMALSAGINRIAMPETETVLKAGNLGLEVQFLPLCCSVGPHRIIQQETCS